MKWRITALISQIIVLIYWLIGEWVDLFPWNDVAKHSFKDNLHNSLSHSLPQLIFIFSFLAAWMAGIRWLMLVSLAGYTYYLAVQIDLWWRPYLFGASETWMQTYLANFGRTYKFLPAIANNPIPDAHHITLQVLSLIAVLTTAIAIVKTRSVRRSTYSPIAVEKE